MWPRSRFADPAWASPLLVLAALAIAAVGALPYAGSWNDGSRLAAVEAIADQHTLAIDDSVFVRVPPELVAAGLPPYPARRADLLQDGTKDRLLIDGHFYSDKPAVISILMAGAYRLTQFLGLPPAAERPDLFAYVLTLLASGGAFAAAAWCVWHLAGHAGLPFAWRMGLAASLCLATVALPYTRHVNNHILQLAVVAALLVHLTRLAEEGRPRFARLVAVGTLAGIGYNLDLGSGPVLLACLLPLVAWRTRRTLPIALFVLAAAPWVVAQLLINHHVGGVWKPMNTVPEYSAWPGCPFNPTNMTGYLRHGPWKLAVYALALLFGKHGFFVHSLPALLALPAAALLVRRRPREWPEALFGAAWCAGTWALYAVFSNNYGGACCSVRWFVPFLAPAFHLIALALRERPDWRADFVVLAAWGAVLGAIMWWYGPWIPHMVPLLWPVNGVALITWTVVRYRAARRPVPLVATAPSRPALAA